MVVVVVAIAVVVATNVDGNWKTRLLLSNNNEEGGCCCCCSSLLLSSLLVSKEREFWIRSNIRCVSFVYSFCNVLYEKEVRA